MPITQRERMVATQLRDRGIRSAAVLAAMASVPREAFVERGFEDAAYDDAALPIGEGQAISQPYIVALMADAAVAFVPLVDAQGRPDTRTRSDECADDVGAGAAARH